MKTYFPLLAILLLLLSGCGQEWPAAETGGEDILWVADWNIENYSLRFSGRKEEENIRKRDGIIGILAEDLSCPDIIALQEIMDDSGIQDDGTVKAGENFASLADRLTEVSGKPYEFATLPPENGMDGGKPGANIRTGFLYDSSRVRPAAPAVRWNDRAFEFCRKPLVLTFDYGGKTIYLINVHLTSRLGGEQASRTRLGQAKALSREIGKILEREKRALILLTGDFNDEPRTKTLTALTLGPYGLNSLVETPTYTYEGTPCQLDHMLATPALSSRRIRAGTLTVRGNGSFPSDHSPLLAGFLLGSPEDLTKD